MTPEDAAEWKRRHALTCKRYRERNREKVAAMNKDWRDRNPDKGRKYASEYRKRNPDKTKEARRQHRKQKPEIQRVSQQRWRSGNPEKCRQYNKIKRGNPDTRKAAQKRRREKITDAYLASSRKIGVAKLRQYPRPVIDAWKAMLQLSRKLKQLKTHIHEIKNDNH